MSSKVDEADKESTEAIPLLGLPSLDEDGSDLTEHATKLVNALQTSGFLLVQSPELGQELQESAIRAATQILVGKHHKDDTLPNTGGIEGVIEHPTDPKLYLMLSSVEDIATKCKDAKPEGTTEKDAVSILTEYWKAVELVKRQILTYLAIGLQLEPGYFVKLHSKNHSALRLLHYPAQVRKASDASENTDKSKADNAEPIIRCKPHSDYGSITLLLTDGVPGLQALIQDEWTPVPYVQGALVVNIGSLLQDWSNGKLLATLHRVVALKQDQAKERTSLAFFADPDPDVQVTLKDPAGMVPTANMYKSVGDYIKWRSGGNGRQRSGLAFSKEEEERAKRAKTSN